MNIVTAIDSAIANICVCGCNTPIATTSPSAWYATPECQQRWYERHAERPIDVRQHPDAAECPDGPATWRPGLVADDFDELRAAPNDIARRLAYPGHIAGYHDAIAWNATRSAWRLRLDDGHRWVALHLDEKAASDPDTVNETWRKLERQLRDRRMAKSPAPAPAGAGAWDCGMQTRLPLNRRRPARGRRATRSRAGYLVVRGPVPVRRAE